MRRVILETPYAGSVRKHTAYARQCMLDCLRRGEAPLASHLLYTQVLDDQVDADRDLGIEAGLAWGTVAEATVCYVDHGISDGMRQGILRAQQQGRPVELRTLLTQPARGEGEA
ncbi:MAG: hypothetical protein GWN84_20815 [Gammaproteobacteria bacterium]|nr:hypothetical protein [Gammaproteobacteria bacterium]NIR85203.1 hypothetical protein [Gammaproteobacteria bacterium]NIU06253.1 hypothetical protein [Gammaproteobacteria bacterium]NIX87526.1 hypothetical protein [Gammaproteobacteria bacterium]